MNNVGVGGRSSADRLQSLAVVRIPLRYQRGQAARFIPKPVKPLLRIGEALCVEADTWLHQIVQSADGQLVMHPEAIDYQHQPLGRQRHQLGHLMVTELYLFS